MRCSEGEGNIEEKNPDIKSLLWSTRNG